MTEYGLHSLSVRSDVLVDVIIKLDTSSRPLQVGDIVEVIDMSEITLELPSVSAHHRK